MNPSNDRKNWTLPNEPFFVRLLSTANDVEEDHIIIHDPARGGLRANYTRFLHDVMIMRDTIIHSLQSDLFDDKGIIREERPFIIIISPPCYYYYVAFYAVLALGGAPAVLSPGILPEEAKYLLNLLKPSCVLFALEYGTKIAEIKAYLQGQIPSQELIDIPMAIPKEMERLGLVKKFSDLNIKIEKNTNISPDRPSVVLFTSGTTGPPKGVVHTRNLYNQASHLGGVDDVFLSTFIATHWVGGTVISTRCLISGTRLEIFDLHINELGVMWDRFRQGDITIVTASPHLWTRLARYFEDEISRLAVLECNAYVDGIRSIRLPISGTISLQPSLLQFWKQTIGLELDNVYNSTELGMMKAWTPVRRDIEASIPKMWSTGDRVLISGTSAINWEATSWRGRDPDATKDAFDKDGFYKTGDEAHLDGEAYIFDGRLNNDFVKIFGFKAPIPAIEIQLMELPYIEEAYVVPVPDPSIIGEHVAALIRLKKTKIDVKQNPATLQNIRRDLTLDRGVRTGSLPTMLRVLREDERIPRTDAGKPLRKQIAKLFFPGISEMKLMSIPEVEVWDFTKNGARTEKPWDWAAMQRSEHDFFTS
ncbi:hypothetical protein FQN57_005027 [Myotisia sp. PD_48]|nr:hypothetical protein FQN57_005027 [Myotisia sp. PD_48]